jgi:hypothetical protein
MNAPTPEATPEKADFGQSDGVLHTDGAAEQGPPAQTEQKVRQKSEIDAERIRSSIARLSSNSVAELEGLAGELRKLDEFLMSETSRVQREIEGALAGIKIIIEAIVPWKRPAASQTSMGRAASLGAISHPSTAFGDARNGR